MKTSKNPYKYETAIIIIIFGSIVLSPVSVVPNLTDAGRWSSAIKLHCDDDFTVSVFFFKIPESFSRLAQQVTAIDHWHDLFGFKEFFHKDSILTADKTVKLRLQG
jgi:hypothetical protein